MNPVAHLPTPAPSSGPLCFPEDAREQADEDRYQRAKLILRHEWFSGMARGYLYVASSLDDRTETIPEFVAESRVRAIPASHFDAWWSATADGSGMRRLRSCAFASGFMAAWADHPRAVPCGNCDLPLVPDLEEGWVDCPSHGMVCSTECRSELCSRDCRDATEGEPRDD